MSSQFESGSGCYRCLECGKMTRETGGGESNGELCARCWERAGEENHHSDNHDREHADPDCRICRELGWAVRQACYEIPMSETGCFEGEKRSVIEINIRLSTGRTPNISDLPGRYLVGSISAGYSARRDWASKPVPGPWAYLIPLPAVMTSSGVDVALGQSALDIRSGDVLKVDGVWYRVRFVLGGRGISSRYELDRDE